MEIKDIVRAWKDEEFRLSLEQQVCELPENPAGAIEIPDMDLKEVFGAADGIDATWHAATMGCDCQFVTQYTCIGLTVCGLICDTIWCSMTCVNC